MFKIKAMKGHERFIISLIWSVASIYFIGYILTHYGDKMEILTLLIGLIGGTIVGSIFGHYYSSAHRGGNVTSVESSTPIDNQPTPENENK